MSKFLRWVVAFLYFFFVMRMPNWHLNTGVPHISRSHADDFPLTFFMRYLMRRRFQKWRLLAVIQEKTAVLTTGGPRSSCKMIILRNKSHGVIIRVCMGIFKTALRNEKYSQILNINITLYFRSASLTIWPLTMLRRAHLGELSISRFTACIRKAQGCTRSIQQS